MRIHISTALIVCLAATTLASAQPQTAPDKFDVLRQRWTAALATVAAERGLRLVDADGNVVSAEKAHRVDAAPEAATAAYEEMLNRTLLDPALSSFFRADPTLVGQQSSPTDQQWADLLKKGALRDVQDKSAKSFNVPLTNPAAAKTAERSGFTEFVGFALDKNVFSANQSAITLSLSALATLGLTSETRSAPATYRDHGMLRRLGGSVTFGAKLPEKEITGLTGLPSAETIFDVFAWDTRLRVYGDRDPRSKLWYALFSGAMGGLVEVNANLLGIVPRGDLAIVQPLLQARVGRSLAIAKHRVAHSTQVSIKASGQHLTEKKGKNKYTAAVLADKGFGNTDLTGNVAYSMVDDVNLGQDIVVSLETWTTVLTINHLAWKDKIVAGRFTELSLGVNAEFPVGDEPLLPVDRKRVWRVVGSVAIPWGASAKIPMSITYASDPNKLKNEKFVTGHIGVTYDFGSLISLFKPQATTP